MVGGTGFVGSHMAKACAGHYQITTSGREVDVRDYAQVHDLIRNTQPDDVVHLAAITTLRESFSDPRTTYDVNFIGTLNVLMSLREVDFTGRILFVSSSEIYGRLGANDLPVSETRLPQPVSPYAVAKIASEALCYQWSNLDKFKIVMARPFNHIGPGQSERFSISDFGKQVAMIKLGHAPPVISVGDISTTRDFTDVRDIVAAYVQLLDRGSNGEIYNVCSGIERTVRYLIERMCELFDLNVDIVTDISRFRASEQKRVFGSNDKLIAATGWQSKFMIDQTLTDIVEDWIDRLKSYAI